MAKMTPQPIRFDEEETKLIKAVQRGHSPKPSVSAIAKRAVRWAAPRILAGEISLFDVQPLQPQRKAAQ